MADMRTALDTNVPQEFLNSSICENIDDVISTTEDAHTDAKVEGINFVDIFGVNSDILVGSSVDSMNVECDGMVADDCSSDFASGAQKLTFSDRVMFESRKLKERMQMRRIDYPGRNTRSEQPFEKPHAIHNSVSDDEFLPYTSWIGSKRTSVGFLNNTPLSVKCIRNSGGHAQLPMQSDEHVMEWFRSRYNAIEDTYTDRALSLDMLSRRVVHIEEPRESLPPVSMTLEHENNRLKEENARLKTLEDEVAHHKQQLSDAMSKMDELENTLAVERKHNEENLKDKLILQQRIANYADELKNLNESMDIIKTMHASELEEQEKHKCELLTKIAQLEKDITHFNDNLFSCYKIIESQKTEQSFLKKQNCNLLDELKRYKVDVRRLYEANSNLKSQNLSLIEINNRIRTRTLFKTDTTDTCSTRDSCSSKASCMSRDEFPFFHVFNDTASTIQCSEYGDSQRDSEAATFNNEHSCRHSNPLQCSVAVGTINSMTKRVITGSTPVASQYDHGTCIPEMSEYPSSDIHEELRNLPPTVEEDSDVLCTSYRIRDQSGNTTNNSGSVFCGKGSSTTKDTCIVDHSTVYSADQSTPNYVESLSMKDLSTESAVEPGGNLNKSWLIEKVTRTSHRNSLDYLKEKIKLITSQDCMNNAFL